MKYKLSDIFNLQMGKTPDRGNLTFWNNGDNKWISISDLSAGEKYISKTKETISNEAVKTSGIKIIPSNTVIMSFKLSIGKTAITVEPIYSNEAIMAFIDKGIIDFDRSYLYYLFANKDWTSGTNKAVMGATLNKAVLSQVEINLPKIEEQEKVVRRLDTLTDIIDNKKRQLLLLDDLIKSRFVEMFGTVEHNEKGWKLNTFKDICTVRQGLQIPISNRLKHCEPGCYEYITVAYLNGSKEREYIKNPRSNVLCKKDDLLMTRTGNTGMVITDVEGVFHNNFFLIDFDRKKYSKTFLYYFLNIPYIQADIRKRAGTSTIPDLNHGDFYKITVYQPPISLQNNFATFVTQVNKSKFVFKNSTFCAIVLHCSG